MNILILLLFYGVFVLGGLSARQIFTPREIQKKVLWTFVFLGCLVLIIIYPAFRAASIPEVLLHLFTAASILAGFMAISRRSTIHSIMFMALNFLCIAVIYLLSSGEFIAVIQVSINTGAVVVMYLFIVMLIEPYQEQTRVSTSLVWTLAGVAAGLFFCILLVYGVLKGNLSEVIVASVEPLDGSVESVGNYLYSYYLVAFEVAALILTVALIGAVIIGRRESD